MKVAVTGATGFVGSHIALALRAAGHQVVALVRRPGLPLLAEAGITFAQADLADPEALANGLSGCEAVVANAALGSGQGSLEEMIRTNVAGTEHTLRAAAAAGVGRVVSISTVAVYKTMLNRSIREDHPRVDGRWDWTRISTDWRYAVSKNAAEERSWVLARELGLRLTALRPGPVYGARDPKWSARMLRSVARPLLVLPTVGVPAVHAGDVAAAVVAALEGPGGRAYNLAGPPVSLARIHRVLAGMRGGARVLSIPLPLHIAFDTTAATRDLGFSSRPLEEGMAELVAGLPPA